MKPSRYDPPVLRFLVWRKMYILSFDGSVCYMINCTLKFLLGQAVRLVSPAGETGMLVVDSLVMFAS